LGDERYLFSATKDEEELNRLALQASIYDPVTIRHLEAIGAVEGWKCLEVGAGAGSIAQWLSKRVGPSGTIVATDIDLRFLNRISAPNLEACRHDILKDNLEKDAYDLVHCRLLLMHLPEPVKALRKMADALSPGGWLLIEEQDYGSMLSADISGAPSSVQFAATCRASNDYVRRKGIDDPYFGRRVRGLVEQLGFTDLGQEGWTSMIRGGDPMADVMAAIWQVVVRARISAGDITREEADKVHSMLLDPAFYYLDATLFSAWGRKPAS
jgi:SAM-dependent methyltransferase